MNTDFCSDSRVKTQAWRFVAELATLQHGVVAYWQLLDGGLSRHWIQRQLAGGRFHRLHRGVYAVGHNRLTRHSHWMAAALACGPVAVLSHRTAGAIQGLLYPRDGWAHVTVAATGRSRRQGIVVHQVATLPRAEHTVVDGFPVTTVARTLLDLAASGDRLLPFAVDAAADRELLDPVAIAAFAGRRGAPALRAAVAAHVPTPHWTRSRLEKRFYRLMRDHGIQLPAVNQWVEGFEVDMLWRDQKLIVEIDGAPHDRPSARLRDPLRDARLQLAGYVVYRVTEDALINRPDEVAATVKAFLARGSG